MSTAFINCQNSSLALFSGTADPLFFFCFTNICVLQGPTPILSMEMSSKQVCPCYQIFYSHRRLTLLKRKMFPVLQCKTHIIFICAWLVHIKCSVLMKAIRLRHVRRHGPDPILKFRLVCYLLWIFRNWSRCLV